MEFLSWMQAIYRLVKRWPLALLAAAAMATSCNGSDDGGGNGGQGGQGGSSGPTSGSGGSGGATTGSGGATTGSGGATTGSGGAPPGECRVQEDCADESAPCYAPGTAPRCGICMRPEITCGDDAICHEMVGPTSICGIEDCMCEPGCIEGCTADSDCEIGQQCAPDHHCTAKECAAPADCPANFDCTDDGTCGRRACTADGDGCEPYCVLGLCYDSLGTCTLPPP
ncbi:hypothetical protein WME91_55930 [Sorangium sp. So ce269]